jgi:hypothetical protein
MSPSFERYVGIGYSGAQTSTSSLKGLRVYEGRPIECSAGGRAAAKPALVLDSQRNRRMAGREARAASITGIFMSRSTISGFNARIFSRPSLPSSASPHTTKE